MRIIFRVDATVRTGTGHLIRCLTLADELAKRGSEIEFVCRKMVDHLAEVILAKGYKLCILGASKSKNDPYCPHADWLEAHWQEDATQTLLKVKGADWLIIDHYAIDEKWESIVHPHVDKILAIDDLADRVHNCDILLDQNYYVDMDKRYLKLVDKHCELLLSPKFALLREEFTFARARLQREFKRPEKLLVFFGGVDANNDIAKALQALADFHGEIIIVAGGANSHYADLKKYCLGRSNLRLFKNVNNMAELMSTVDVAIGSGGSTSWERATLGLPTLAWPIADNQIRILQDLDIYGALKITSPEKLQHDLQALNAAAMSKMSAKAMQLCDAQGAVRVANRILS